MKTCSAFASAVVLLLGANLAESSWSHLGGFDGFGRYPTVERDWGHARGHVRHPQRQHHGWPRGQAPHYYRPSAQMPTTPSLHRSPPPPTLHPPPVQNSDPNADFTAAFLKHAGEDVILSAFELQDLVHAASGQVVPPTRRSVLEILQQWDTNRDGGLNLSEFIRMYSELQRQVPSTFQQHWRNLRSSLAQTTLSDKTPESQDAHLQAQQPPTQLPQTDATPTHSPHTRHHDKTASRQKMDADTGASGEFQPRKGRLNYIEKGVRFFELEFDDEDHENGDGPLTVQTIVSSRIIGDVDSWAESDVW